MRRVIILAIGAIIVVIAATAQAAHNTADKETKQFLKAKSSVFDRDWEGARRRLDEYLDRYPDGRFEEEARYWLARSCNQLSREAKRPEDTLRLKESAIQNVDALLKKYPNSIWKDDAETLRMQVAAQLALLGKKKYQQYIQEVVTEGKVEETELKIIALEALMKLGPEVALPLVESILNEDADPKLRMMAVTLVGQFHGEEALPLLRHLETEDRDPEIREKAGFWRNKIEALAIQVELHYYGFVATLGEKTTRIPERGVRVFDIPPPSSSSKGNAEKAVKKLFGKELSDVKFAANATIGMEAQLAAYRENMSTSHNLADYRVQVPIESIEKSYFGIKGKASFFDKYTDREYVEKFTVDADDAKLMAARHGNEVAILVLVFESSEEPLEDKGEPVYYTEFSNVFGAVVHSSRQSWSMEEIKASVVEYGLARAEMPGEGGLWTLIGHIQLHSKTKRFIARDAVLYDPKHREVARALEIVVPVEKPSEYEVRDR